MTGLDPKALVEQALGLKEGQTLFPWQEALLEKMLEGTPPELIDIPTGLGKTSIVAIWAVARHCRAQLPRRLVYCLPMRVLVQQTRARAIEWLARINLLAGDAVLEGRTVKSYQAAWGLPDKVAVVTLMGGEAADDWVEHPEQPAVLVGTQDMLLSRALNRGFAMAPQRWPVDFGFLNVDTLWVMDEVQLMGPGRTTSVQLQCFWEKQPPGHGSRRTVWMSATLGSQQGLERAQSLRAYARDQVLSATLGSQQGLEQPLWMRTPERENASLSNLPLRRTQRDLEHPEFRGRWSAPKGLVLRLGSDSAESREKEARGPRRVKTASRHSDSERGWTVESNELKDEIRKQANGGRLVLAFVNQVGRARSLYEGLKEGVESGPEVLLLHARMRQRDRNATEDKLDSAPPSSGRIVVTTQVLEAGVDVDADALFTELCPWPSLVQRLGRLNRSGTRPSAEAVESGESKFAPAIVFDLPLPPRKLGESKKDYEKRSRRDCALPYDYDAIEETRGRLERIGHGGSVSLENLAKEPLKLPWEGPVLRRFDLDDLFDTDPDLSGGHTDVSPFVRGADRDVDAYILWRRIKDGLKADEQVPIHRDELCPVPFYEAQEAFKYRDVWILTLATGRKRGAAWRRAGGGDIERGDTVMVDVSAGGYREDTGWTGDAKDRPNMVVDRYERGDGSPVRAWVRLDAGGRSLVEEIDQHVEGPRARGEDPRSFSKQWLELQPHLERAEQEARLLANTLRLPTHFTESVATAARWHDVGKALERDVNGAARQPFQEMLRKAGKPEGGHPVEGVLYAKSNGRGGQPAGFRHELASLLAFLEANHSDDLAAYLILAHHGKVRILLEAWEYGDPSDLCGVRGGDRIPPAALPSGSKRPVVLDPQKLLPSQAGPGWQGRVAGLLDQHGPFLLAHLEGLVRVADWRAGS